MWPPESEWRPSVPEVLTRTCRRWKLTLGEELTGGSASVVHAVRTAQGTDAVLKLSLPHREARDEALALRSWDGRGAVRLLDHDRDDFALLLERCDPGTPLTGFPLPEDERLAVMADALATLWSARTPTDAGFESLAEVAAERADEVEGRMARLRPPYDPEVIAHGVRLLRTLATGATPVLLHGDANPGNLLAARRSPWLAIDPKPMLGDAAYDPVPALLQIGTPPTGPELGTWLHRRIDAFAARAGLDPSRVADWAVARLVEWALWYADRGDVAGGAGQVEIAAALLGRRSPTPP